MWGKDHFNTEDIEMAKKHVKDAPYPISLRSCKLKQQ